MTRAELATLVTQVGLGIAPCVCTGGEFGYTCCACKAREALPGLLAVCDAAAALLKIIESDDVPGYIYDEHSAECVGCGKIAATIADVQHEPDCFQGAIERVRGALGDLEVA